MTATGNWYVDPATLDARVSYNVKVANHWHHENGDTDYSFSFPVKDTLEIFGTEIDNKLDFSSHISNLGKRINNQFNVMLRFRKLTPRDTLLKLYKAYILPHFDYCSSVWHFCGTRNTDKLEALNKRILRFILGDYLSPYDSLLTRVNNNFLYNKRVQKFLILLYKSLFFTHFPAYMKDMFSPRYSSYNLVILSLRKPRTTSYGLNSFSYFSSKL